MRKNFNYILLLLCLMQARIVSAQQPTQIWPTADQATINASQFSTAASIFKSTRATPNPAAGFTGWVSKGVNAGKTEDIDSTHWEWSSDNTAKAGLLWGARRPLASPSANNGCAVFNSDFYDTGGRANNFGGGISPSPHSAELISPRVNAQGAKNIVVDFHQYYRRYDSECFIQYSNDGGATWSRAVSVNPRIVPLDETDNAAVITNIDSTKKRIIFKNVSATNQFHVKFLFDGDYYFWLIDDVKISSIDEFYDLSVTDFAATPTSYITPRGQIDTVRFLADIRNGGTKAMNGVRLRVDVLNLATNASVYTGQTTANQYPQPVKADTTYENRILPTALSPASLPVGGYVGRYRVFGDSSARDIDPSNDFFDFVFYVSDSSRFILGNNTPARGNYVKETGALNGIRLANSSWATATEPRSSRYGMYFRFNSDKANITSMTANIFPTAAAGRRLQGSLYEFRNTNGNFSVEPAERTLVAFGEVEVPNIVAPATSLPQAWYVFPLTDFSTGGTFKPKAKTDYLAIVEFDGPTKGTYDSDRDYIFMGNTFGTFYYGASRFVTDSVENSPRYNIVTGTTATDTWSLAGFQDSTVSFCVRLNVTPLDPTAIKNELSDKNTLAISPNPVGTEGVLNVAVSLEKQSDMLLRVYDMAGKLEMEQVLDKFKEGQIQVSTTELATGAHILQIFTPDGYLTKKFVKSN